MWIRQVKIMPDENVVNAIVGLVLTNFVVDFGLLGRKNFKALDTLHVWLPLFEIWKVVKLINNPVKKNNITASKSVNFLHFLFFPMVINLKLFRNLHFLPLPINLIYFLN